MAATAEAVALRRRAAGSRRRQPPPRRGGPPAAARRGPRLATEPLRRGRAAVRGPGGRAAARVRPRRARTAPPAAAAGAPGVGSGVPDGTWSPARPRTRPSWPSPRFADQAAIALERAERLEAQQRAERSRRAGAAARPAAGHRGAGHGGRDGAGDRHRRVRHLRLRRRRAWERTPNGFQLLARIRDGGLPRGLELPLCTFPGTGADARAATVVRGRHAEAFPPRRADRGLRGRSPRCWCPSCAAPRRCST